MWHITSYSVENTSAKWKTLPWSDKDRYEIGFGSHEKSRLLFKEMPVDFKLLLEHDLPSILNNEDVRIKVLGGTKDLPVFLHTRHTS